MQRVHLIISGDVQGVGFRAWVKKLAKDVGLVGWVKNRDDGAVEVVAEGSKDTLEQLIGYCHNGPEASLVKQVDVTWKNAIGEYPSFDVVY